MKKILLLGTMLTLSAPAYCATYSYELVRSAKVVLNTNAADQVIITLPPMPLGNYNCSGNGGFDESVGPPGTIYHVKAAVSPTSTLTGGHAAGKNSIEVPYNEDGTYVTIPTGMWRLNNITTAYLILNAYWEVPTSHTFYGFGYIQCDGPL